MEREIVIVGAGPTGSVAATALVQKGHDVLLLDRKDFPRDKACGDGIPAGAIEILYSLGMEERVRDANYYAVDRLLLSSPRGYVVEAARTRPMSRRPPACGEQANTGHDIVV